MLVFELDKKLEGLTLERVTGIEPAFSAWKADALPLCYTRFKEIITK